MFRIPFQRPINRGFERWHDLIYIFDMALQYVTMDIERSIRFVIKVNDDSSLDYSNVEEIKND